MSVPLMCVAFFEENERVLCFHGPLLYEGKILKVKYQDGDFFYYIHYAGWKKNWDEWVVEKRVLKFSQSNLLKQKDLKTAFEINRANKRKSMGKSSLSSKKAKSVGSDSGSVNVSSGSRPSTPVSSELKPSKSKSLKIDVLEAENAKRRKNNEAVEEELHFETKQQIHFGIPDLLKSVLVNDWDLISRQKRLINIPAKITVDKVLDDYAALKEKTYPKVPEFCSGMKDYFNLMLGKNLLFRFEKQQYMDIVKTLEMSKIEGSTPKGMSLTNIYSSYHLLRMFTILGEFTAYTSLDPEAVEDLQESVKNFMRFLEEHALDYFCKDDYIISAPEYQRINA